VSYDNQVTCTIPRFSVVTADNIPLPLYPFTRQADQVELERHVVSGTRPALQGAELSTPHPHPVSLSENWSLAYICYKVRTYTD
jgi:hypothetical protein